MHQLYGKILIISDTHLTHYFDIKKYQFLMGLLDCHDTIVLNGDFWDGYLCTLDQVLHSDWRLLLARLRQKKTYYLYGNHDPQQRDEGLYKNFSRWHGDALDCQIGDRVYHIEHGHRFAHSFDHWFAFLPHKTFGLGGVAESLMIKIFGPSSLCLYAPDNLKMKRWKATHLPKETFLVTGHSHWAELSQENAFANSGMIRWGIASYLTIEDSNVALQQDNY